MECRDDFDCRKPTDLSVYFRQVPNSVNVCFLDNSTCIVLKNYLFIYLFLIGIHSMQG